MTGKPKAILLALCAAFAIGVLPSAAAAETFQIMHEPALTKVTGFDHNGGLKWQFDTGEMECKHETETGAFEEFESEVDIAVEPAFSECAGFAGTVDPNGCKFIYGGGNIEGGKFEGAFDISCATKSIEITSANCVVTVPSQNGVKKVTYTNVGAGKNRELTVEFNVTGLKYTEDKKGSTPCKGGSKTNGTLTGFRTVTGEDNAQNMVGIWAE